MNKYYTYISKKQIGVIFANYKNGNLEITDDIVKFLYNNCAEVRGLNNNNRYEDVLQRVKSGLDKVFAKNFAEASEEIIGAYNLYNAIFQA